MKPDDLAADELIWRIQAEFMEMPGLRLNLVEAQRLWNLDPIRCEAVLSTLLELQVLTRGLDQRFALRRSTP